MFIGIEVKQELNSLHVGSLKHYVEKVSFNTDKGIESLSQTMIF